MGARTEHQATDHRKTASAGRKTNARKGFRVAVTQKRSILYTLLTASATGPMEQGTRNLCQRNPSVEAVEVRERERGDNISVSHSFLLSLSSRKRVILFLPLLSLYMYNIGYQCVVPLFFLCISVLVCLPFFFSFFHE